MDVEKVNHDQSQSLFYLEITPQCVKGNIRDAIPPDSIFVLLTVPVVPRQKGRAMDSSYITRALSCSSLKTTQASYVTIE